KMEQCIGCGSCMLACARARYQSLSLDRSAVRVRTAGGFRSSVIADLCLGCREPACAAVCNSGALVPRPGGGVIVKRDRCLGCRRCVEACTVRGIHYDDELGYPVVCAHCGVCTRFCPHGCLVLEEADAS
nr:4Fe-4S dicluster domain-containing protein [Dehalococcoidales bacterium]